MKIINSIDCDFIEIPDKFIIRLDEFLSLELPGFNWGHHTYKCKTCESFINSFGKDIGKWIVEFENEFYKLEANSFGKINSHFDNNFRFDSNIGSLSKFKIINLNISKDELHKYEKLEEYEICAFIRDKINKS